MKSAAIERMNQAGSVCIVSHVRPDGDAYGSMLGLGLSLLALGKRVKFLNEDGMNSIYGFLPGAQLVEKLNGSKPSDCEVIVSVDSSTQKRLGDVFQKWNRKVDINIDHHVSNELYGSINWVRSDLPSTASLVLDLIQSANWPLTRDIAENLYVGLCTDTGSFRYEGTTVGTFKDAAKLVAEGADPAELARRCYQSLSIERFELGRLAMQGVKFECGGELAYLRLTAEMFKKSGAQPEDSEGIVEKMQEINQVQASVIFDTSIPEYLRVSFRSKGKIDVNQIALEFGGGGHPLAAGVKMRGETEDNIKKILARLRAALTV